MEKARDSESNAYSLQPRDVRLSIDERAQLASEAKEAIDEAFLFTNYSESLATIQPIELFPITPNETYDLLTSRLPYDRAYVNATIDHDSDDASLRTATIILFHNKWLKTIRSEIVITRDDDIDDADRDIIDPENPFFYMNTPMNLETYQRERIPLSYTMCKELLNHVVMQANPIAYEMDSNRTIQNCIEALFTMSDETSLSRTSKYRFYPNDDEQLVVSVHDRALVRPQKEPIHTYHEANVEKIRSFGKAGTLSTSLQLTTSKHETSATISKEYLYEEDCVDDIEERIEEVTQENRSVSIDSAQEFGKQIISSIYLLAAGSIGSNKAEQLES